MAAAAAAVAADECEENSNKIIFAPNDEGVIISNSFETAVLDATAALAAAEEQLMATQLM
jgi:hypothetical protein